MGIGFWDRLWWNGCIRTGWYGKGGVRFGHGGSCHQSRRSIWFVHAPRWSLRDSPCHMESFRLRMWISVLVPLLLYHCLDRWCRVMGVRKLVLVRVTHCLWLWMGTLLDSPHPFGRIWIDREVWLRQWRSGIRVRRTGRDKHRSVVGVWSPVWDRHGLWKKVQLVLFLRNHHRLWVWNWESPPCRSFSSILRIWRLPHICGGKRVCVGNRGELVREKQTKYVEDSKGDESHVMVFCRSIGSPRTHTPQRNEL